MALAIFVKTRSVPALAVTVSSPIYNSNKVFKKTLLPARCSLQDSLQEHGRTEIIIDPAKFPFIRRQHSFIGIQELLQLLMQVLEIRQIDFLPDLVFSQDFRIQYRRRQYWLIERQGIKIDGTPVI